MEGLQGSTWGALENAPLDEADQPNKAALEEAFVHWKGVPTEADDALCCDLHLFSAVSICTSSPARARQARREIARLRTWQSVKTDA